MCRWAGLEGKDGPDWTANDRVQLVLVVGDKERLSTSGTGGSSTVLAQSRQSISLHITTITMTTTTTTSCAQGRHNMPPPPAS